MKRLQLFANSPLESASLKTSRLWPLLLLWPWPYSPWHVSWAMEPHRHQGAVACPQVSALASPAWQRLIVGRETLSRRKKNTATSSYYVLKTSLYQASCDPPDQLRLWPLEETCARDGSNKVKAFVKFEDSTFSLPHRRDSQVRILSWDTTENSIIRVPVWNRSKMTQDMSRTTGVYKPPPRQETLQ